MSKTEHTRRINIMVAVHGEWVRRHFAVSTGRTPHCDCSRCGLSSVAS